MTPDDEAPRAWSPVATRLTLPDGHRFPLDKYTRLAERLGARGWRVEAAPLASWEALASVHDAAYLAAVRARSLDARAERRLGFPQSEALVARFRASVGGTLAATEDALERGVGIHLAGGTHHAFADRGEGFCLFNDLAVAARAARARGVPRVAIVDLDVHQGNGSARIFGGDPRVATFSVHGVRNYPFDKERSDRDVALPDGTDDDAYLAALTAELPPFLERVRPALILYQAGVDVLAGDRFGRMALSEAGVVARDRLVYREAVRVGAALVWTMGGGYHRDIDLTVAAHAAGLEALRDLAPALRPPTSPRPAERNAG